MSPFRARSVIDTAHKRDQRDHWDEQRDEGEHLGRCADAARVPHAAEVIGSQVKNVNRNVSWSVVFAARTNLEPTVRVCSPPATWSATVRPVGLAGASLMFMLRSTGVTARIFVAGLPVS